MNSIKKSRKGQQYKKKINKEQRDLIKQLLIEKIKNPSEIAKEYNIPRSTINSYKKSKRPMYDPLKNAILKRAEKWVDMNFDTLNNYKSIPQVKKQINSYFNKECFFSNSEMNPLFYLIPKSKQNSKKQRIHQKVLQEVFTYFQTKKLLNNNQTNEQYFAIGTVIEVEIYEAYIQNCGQEEPYQNIQNLYPNNTQVVQSDESFKVFNEDSFNYYY
ncbi:unnamed protein product [Paramecium pentaurelia]|uniref:HTH psq-type domain-containing protein n=1 Tax=Paramecium pentaurelia TaxID=43138 RepID=A0A8S1SM81_9CILI|nr:unnamed protein product [Paramecium pentaurelia]